MEGKINKIGNDGYVSPEISVIEVKMQGVIAASGDTYDVTNPFGGNTEQIW